MTLRRSFYKRLFLSAVIAMLNYYGAQAQSVKIETARIIKEKDLIPEGITYDKKDKSFYVGSIYKRKIVKIDSSGTVSDFIQENEDGIYNVLGMKVESNRRIIWVCSYAGGGFNEEKGFAGIFKYNLNNGKLIKKYLLDNKITKHLFNDIVITSAGDAYFTDTDTGIIYSIDHKKDSIEVFIKAGSFDRPNGIALSPDERYLFISDNLGLHRADMKGKVKELNHPAGIAAGGIDGLYFYRNSLVAVQNDFNPQRIVRFALNKNLDEIEKMILLCQDNPLVFIPTTGVIVGDIFYIIGNSQLHLIKDGRITDYEKLENVRIVKIQL